MEQLFLISEITLFCGLTFIALYTFILSISGWIGYRSIEKRKKPISERLNKIAILIPAYKEDAVIEKVAHNMNQLDYPKNAYDVYVIADSMKKSTLEKISKKVKVIEVSFEKSTKSKSLNYALDRISGVYEIALISDGDNFLDNTFLTSINKAYNRGSKAIQGHRIAKNTDTKMAILDAASEEINNHIYRRGLNGLGLSSAIIGSGMAFDFKLFKELMSNNKAVGGFDKILQLAVIERQIKIEYLHKAIVYDEKIDNPKSFQNQRKRWVSSQLKYLSKNFFKGWKLLFKGNFDYFNISIICGMMPPRIILIGILCIVSLLLLFLPEISVFGVTYWVGLTIFYLFTLLICIPNMVIHPSFLLALLHIPAAFVNMLLAIFKTKNADERFIHTKHTNSSVTNIFRK